MNILLTGGAGFIGSHVAERLLQRGDRVIIVDDLNDFYDPRIKEANVRAVLSFPEALFLRGDILDPMVLDRAFREQPLDLIVHLAARAGVRPSLRDPLLYEQVNVQGTLLLLEAARRHNIRRFVFASSSSVYGNVRDIPFREDARVDQPISPYAASKVAGEVYGYTYYHLYGISFTALRFFTVYGPRQRPDMAIHRFARRMVEGRPVPFYGDGSTRRDYTYIDDIVVGVLAAVDRDLGYEIINLGESRTTTLSELVGLLERSLGMKATLDCQPLPPGDMLVTCADLTKARRLLDYQPTVPIEEGMRRFIQWFRTSHPIP